MKAIGENVMYLHYRLSICPFQIRVENAEKPQVMRTVFSTRIPNSQSPLFIDNALNCNETHLPVYQSIQLIYQRELTFITA